MSGTVFNGVILERMKVELDEILREQQTGLRNGRSCIDQQKPVSPNETTQLLSATHVRKLQARTKGGGGGFVGCERTPFEMSVEKW